MVLSTFLECSFLQILIFIGQTWFLYAVCIALILLGYIFLSFSNADVRLAKELKIECRYENKVNRTNSTKLRNELKLLRQVLLDNSLVGLSPSRSSSFISRPRWDISIISKIRNWQLQSIHFSVLIVWGQIWQKWVGYQRNF